MAGLIGFPHNVRMAKKHQPPKHFIRAWRKSVPGLTLEKLADRVGTTHATLSRIERGKLPYSQPLLEALAEAIGTTPASLLMRDPSVKESIWDILAGIPPTERDNAAKALTGFMRKTGTHG